jgi:ferredoxin
MKIKSVKIDKERCIGCGSCAALAPAAFTVDIEESKAEVKEGWEKVPPNDLRRAATACPVQAITLEG